MILYMYIAPGQWLTTPWGPNFNVNRNILSLRSFVASFKKISLKSDFIQFFFHILYMYIAPGQGQTTTGDKMLMSTETSCHFAHLLQVSKNLFEVWFYTIFFKILYMDIAPGQGLTTPWGRNFNVNRNVHLVTSVFCCKFQKHLFEVWFYTIFFITLYMYIAPGQGQTAPRGQSFDVNRNTLSLHSFVASFKKMSLKSDFIHFFIWFNTCI